MNPFFLAPLGVCLLSYHTGMKKEGHLKMPNIIFFMTDDLGLGDLQVYNPNTTVPTPHINRLAEEGILFTNVHSPAALCSPTRYSVLTGRYAWRDGLRKALQGISEPVIASGQSTVGTFLREKGYRTALIGKWHIGMRFAGDYEVLPKWSVSKMPRFTGDIVDGPLDHGFDYFFGVEGNFNLPQTCDFFIENRTVLDAATIREKGLFHKAVNQVVSGYVSESWRSEDLSRLCLEKALRFIDDHMTRYGDQPFYLHFVPNVIHTPFTPNDSLFDEPVSGRGGICEKRGELIVETDIMVGTMIRYLEEHGLAENTLLVFTSDNGGQTDALSEERGHMTSLQWAGSKGMIMEGGHRVPYIVYYPAGGVKAGTVNDLTFGLIDWFASVKGLVMKGKDEDQACYDSEDFSAVYRGGKPQGRSHPLIVAGSNISAGPTHHPFRNISNEYLYFNAVYRGDMKLILKDPGGTPAYLYNLGTNIEETENLLDQYPRLVRKMSKRYREAVDRVQPRSGHADHP